MNIAVARTRYGSFSSAMLLSQYNKVTAVDIILEKVDLINAGASPIQDNESSDFLTNKALNLTATTDGKTAYKDAEFVIIATPL